MLGIVQTSGANMAPVGVEYVMATQSGQAILRPLRYPLYDSESFVNGQSDVRTLFTDHKKFQNGLPKTEADGHTRRLAA